MLQYQVGLNAQFKKYVSFCTTYMIHFGWTSYEQDVMFDVHNTLYGQRLPGVNICLLSS